MFKLLRPLMGWTALLTTLLLALSPVHGNDDSAYRAVTGPCGLQFPRDHGPHPEFRTEWWYYTGNVQSPDGRHFGFQLTFFRTRISPPRTESSWPEPHSAWRTPQIYLAHAALTDVAGKHFLHAETVGREALKIAGADEENGIITIHVKDWLTHIEPVRHLLKAETDDFALDLQLTPQKPPVLHGQDGYSLKGSTPERASCYYSFTRMEANGTIRQDGETLSVHGLAWMDHEFSSAPLEPDLLGWEWFSLQFADGTELMVYLLRRKDGSYSPASSGTFVNQAGEGIHIQRSDIQVKVLDHWTSPHSGATYPSGWLLQIPSRQLECTVTPRVKDQELQTPFSTGITYWEGTIAANGTNIGEGYVELTGFEHPLDGRL